MQPRERYARFGPTHFGDEELLALLIGTGSAHHSPRQIAAALLEDLGGLSGIAEASLAELQAVAGVGLARAVQVQAALHLGRRGLLPREPAPLITSTADAAAQFVAIIDRSVEVLAALYLNRQRRLLACIPLTQGSDAHTVVDPRQVFRPAVRCGAAAVILAHNHPSGDLRPSGPDLLVTRRLVEAGQIIGIELLDHLILTRGGHTSLAEQGVLTPRVPFQGLL